MPTNAAMAVLALTTAISISQAALSNDEMAALDKLPGAEIPITMHIEGRTLAEVVEEFATSGPFKVTFEDDVGDLRIDADWETQSLKQVLVRLGTEYGLSFEVPSRAYLVVRRHDRESASPPEGSEPEPLMFGTDGLHTPAETITVRGELDRERWSLHECSTGESYRIVMTSNAAFRYGELEDELAPRDGEGLLAEFEAIPLQSPSGGQKYIGVGGIIGLERGNCESAAQPARP